jgi:hypothetical protein
MVACAGSLILYNPHEESLQWHHRPKLNVAWKSSSSSSSVGRTASGTIKAAALSRGDGPASAAGGGVSAKSKAFEWIPSRRLASPRGQASSSCQPNRRFSCIVSSWTRLLRHTPSALAPLDRTGTRREGCLHRRNAQSCLARAGHRIITPCWSGSEQFEIAIDLEIALDIHVLW